MAFTDAARGRGVSRRSRRPFLVIAGHHPVAQHLVGRLDGIEVQRELLLTGVLSQELQSELEILEPLRAQFAQRLLRLERQIDQAFDGGGCKTQTQTVALEKALLVAVECKQGCPTAILAMTSECALHLDDACQ